MVVKCGDCGCLWNRGIVVGVVVVGSGKVGWRLVVVIGRWGVVDMSCFGFLIVVGFTAGRDLCCGLLPLLSIGIVGWAILPLCASW